MFSSLQPCLMPSCILPLSTRSQYAIRQSTLNLNKCYCSIRVPSSVCLVYPVPAVYFVSTLSPSATNLSLSVWTTDDVGQPGEERRTHQWSFKPSAATVLSHAAVFLTVAARYVGVQQGSTLVSWRECEQDVKRPLSSQVRSISQVLSTHQVSYCWYCCCSKAVCNRLAS